VYGNVVKISTASESSHAILSLCEVEVYAVAYGKGQGNKPLASFFVKHSTKHFVANDQPGISRIPNKLQNDTVGPEF